MMRKFILLSVALFMAVYAFGQKASDEKAISSNPFKKYWFFQIQGGTSLTYNERNKGAGLGDIIAPHAAISFGRHLSPVVGLRLQFGGWESRCNGYRYWFNETKKYKRNYLQGNFDCMVNFSNVFIRYTHEKAINVYVVGGLTYMRVFKSKDIDMDRLNCLGVRAGLQVDYRLNNTFSINLEAISNFIIEDGHYGGNGGPPNDRTLNIMAGLTFRL